MRITNDSIELNLAVDGPADAPAVLMLHGITMSVATWDFVVPVLTESCRVFRLDFRGHGDSDRAPGAYGMGSYVTDALAAVETGIGGPCVVVGHSLGGVTAAALAQQRPDLVRALVLEDPAIFADAAAGSVTSATDALADNSLLDVFRLIYESTPRLQAAGIAVADLARLLAAAPSPSGPPAGELYCDDTFEAWAASQLALDVEVLAPVIDPTAMDPGDFVAGAFEISTPITVPGVILAGDPAKPDTVLRAAAIEALAATSPGLEVRVVDGAGHMIHDGRSSRDIFVAALSAVVAEHGG